MMEIINKGTEFVREVWDRSDAINYFKSIGEDYKAKIVNDLPENEEITVYKQGDWLDLCRGPHFTYNKAHWKIISS